MKKINKKILAVTLGSALFITGCSTKEDNSNTAQSTQTAQSTGGKDLIKYNKGSITQETVLQELGDTAVNKAAVDVLIKKLLLDKYGSKIDEKYLNTQLEDTIKQYGGEEAFNEALKAQGFTLDKFKETNKARYAQALLFLEHAGVSDEKLKEEYDKTKTQYSVAHVLVGVKSDTFPGGLEKAEAKKRIDAAKKALDSGKSFEEVAREYSMDTDNAKNGGVIGWVSQSDLTLTDDFKSHVFKLKKGETSAVVETGFGYHIIKVVDTKDVPFEELKPFLVEQTAQKLSQEKPEATGQAVRKLLEENGVEAKTDSIKKYLEESTTVPTGDKNI